MSPSSLSPRASTLAEAETVRLTPRHLRAGPTGPLAEAARWGAVALSAGRFSLHEIHPKRDVPLLHAWMNDPSIAHWWDLAGDEDVVRRHLATRALRAPGGCYLGCVDDEPISYWELYRADLDELARVYPARPHDVGIHLLVGPPAWRGRGIGSLLLRAVTELVLRAAPDTARVVAEPDVRNTISIAAFERAGFERVATLELPDKAAALMMRHRVPSEAGARP
ncbi:GNAT family N-acetyltransferase [Streptomyces sp. SID3343]|uniref:GNAT family N-acetyltransferase n=1 Tax=Streptomyces sp. SID3343 TaxID=2690260 RepID=UPI00136C79BF|nr:GNAT family N-acetyltransferase [Streptomyces sp. SID3343]MYW05857.1 GNAT family N-acetyltransferase [Streptomyces sp. SID3343]